MVTQDHQKYRHLIVRTTVYSPFMETVHLSLPFSRYMVTYLSKVENFFPNAYIWRPRWGWPH